MQQKDIGPKSSSLLPKRQGTKPSQNAPAFWLAEQLRCSCASRQNFAAKRSAEIKFFFSNILHRSPHSNLLKSKKIKMNETEWSESLVVRLVNLHKKSECWKYFGPLFNIQNNQQVVLDRNYCSLCIKKKSLFL